MASAPAGSRRGQEASVAARHTPSATSRGWAEPWDRFGSQVSAGCRGWATSRRPAPPISDFSDSKRQRPRRGAALGIYQRVGCAAPAARVLLQDAKLDERVDVPARSVL